MATPAPTPAEPAPKTAPAPETPEVPMSRRRLDAEGRIRKDEWNVDAWNTVLNEAAELPFVSADVLYSRLVKQFPTHARYWNARAAHCARDASTPSTAAKNASAAVIPEVVPLGAVLGDSSKSTVSAPESEATATTTEQPPPPPTPPVDPVVQIYEAAVRDAPTSVEIWRAYTAYALSRAPAGQENSVSVIFDRAVEAAGLDLHASPMLQDYIDFLKTRASLSDSQRRDALRRLYHRSICSPVHGLEKFWRDYTEFEQKANTNKEIGRALLAEYHPKNVDARTEFRARKGRREGLALNALPIPPRFRAAQASQAAEWRRFIAQEEANKSSLPAEELHSRVVHAYESALVPLYRYPDMWIDYLAYLYGALLPPIEVPIVASPVAGAKPAEQEPAKIAMAAAAMEPVAARAVRALPDCIALAAAVSEHWLRLNEPAKAVEVLSSLCKSHSSVLAYINLMRVVRRVEGRDSARKVFGRARRDPNGRQPAVYIAAAKMEFGVNRDTKVAKNIFELGIKNFADSAVMASAFVEWLAGQGDFEFMRVVFEKVMPIVKGDAAIVGRLWEMWVEVETNLGDPASVDRVEEMWRMFGGVGRPNDNVGNALRRVRYMGMEGMTEAQLAVRGGGNMKQGGGGGGGGGGNASGGGKRDPRTGRRVQSSGGNASGNGGGSNAHGGRNGGSSKPNAMSVATEALMRLAASLGHVAGPLPDIEFVLDLIRQTPINFAHTPAGGGMRPGMVNGMDEANAGKKRKADDAATDVWRTRQAAKQKRGNY